MPNGKGEDTAPKVTDVASVRQRQIDGAEFDADRQLWVSRDRAVSLEKQPMTAVALKRTSAERRCAHRRSKK